MTEHYNIIEKDGKWYFAYLPRNNNTIDIGRSPLYDSAKECKEALTKFRAFIKKNNVSSLSSKYVVIEENIFESAIIGKVKMYTFKYTDFDGNVLFYRPGGYVQKQNAKKIIEGHYKKLIESPLTEQNE